MSRNRLEITLSDEQLGQLDEARGHEPRASFVKRAVAAFVFRDPLTKLVQDGPGFSGEQMRGGMRAVMERPVAHRVSGHLPTCRCPVCKP